MHVCCRVPEARVDDTLCLHCRTLYTSITCALSHLYALFLGQALPEPRQSEKEKREKQALHAVCQCAPSTTTYCNAHNNVLQCAQQRTAMRTTTCCNAHRTHHHSVPQRAPITTTRCNEHPSPQRAAMSTQHHNVLQRAPWMVPLCNCAAVFWAQLHS